MLSKKYDENIGTIFVTYFDMEKRKTCKKILFSSLLEFYMWTLKQQLANICIDCKAPVTFVYGPLYFAAVHACIYK